MNIPENLRYTKDHEWVKVDGDVATVGISEFAVEQLGDITLVEMPDVGNEIKAGETIGIVESVKAVSDVYAPISGTVKAINEELDDAPEKVNEDCFGAGWMLQIQISDPAEVEALFDSAGYKDHVSSLDD